MQCGCPVCILVVWQARIASGGMFGCPACLLAAWQARAALAGCLPGPCGIRRHAIWLPSMHFGCLAGPCGVRRHAIWLPSMESDCLADPFGLQSHATWPPSMHSGCLAGLYGLRRQATWRWPGSNLATKHAFWLPVRPVWPLEAGNVAVARQQGGQRLFEVPGRQGFLPKSIHRPVCTCR